MAKVAIVTDSVADLSPDIAAAQGIRVVALNVHFGDQTFRAGVDLSVEQFWTRMTAPDAPFPSTSAASPGAYQEAFQTAFDGGADSIVCVDCAETLSGTIKSARIAAGLFPDREIHVMDSRSASMGIGILALLGAEMATLGASAFDIADRLEARRTDTDLFVVLDTLAYLRKGGRLSGPQAAIGTLLSVKPIITLNEGVVEVADRPRTRSKARERVLELLTTRPVERVAILSTPPADTGPFRDELLARLPNRVAPDHVSIQTIGPSVGPHLGPGCLGAVVLYAR